MWISDVISEQVNQKAAGASDLATRTNNNITTDLLAISSIQQTFPLLTSRLRTARSVGQLVNQTAAGLATVSMHSFHQIYVKYYLIFIFKVCHRIQDYQYSIFYCLSKIPQFFLKFIGIHKVFGINILQDATSQNYVSMVTMFLCCLLFILCLSRHNWMKVFWLEIQFSI